MKNQFIKKMFLGGLAFSIMAWQCNFSLAQPPSNTLPQDPTTVYGSATYHYSGNTLNQDTTSNRTITNWGSASVGSKAVWNINQPTSSSVSLNRVTGADPSYFYGQLNSNGHVWVINPNGIINGGSGNINVNGLVASTLDISNQNFLNGNYIFNQTGGQSYILNQGKIVANGGYVALLSNAVHNDGAIVANLGSVVMAAGKQMTLLSLDDKNDVSVDINSAVNKGVLGPDGKPIASAVENDGTIQANGGKIILTASVLKRVFDNAVNNNGVIEANGISNQNGIIELTGSGGDVISNKDSDLQATGGLVNVTSTGNIGLGQVSAAGGTVNLTSGGDITQAGYGIQAQTLNVTDSEGSTTLNSPHNAINTLGVIETPGHSFELEDDIASGLTESGYIKAQWLALDNTTGNISLTSQNNLIPILENINVAGNTFDLVDNIATGLNQGGHIVAGTLDLENTAGYTFLTDFRNQINVLGNIYTPGHSFELVDNINGGLTQSGSIDANWLDVINTASNTTLNSSSNMINNLSLINAGSYNFILFDNTSNLNISKLSAGQAGIENKGNVEVGNITTPNGFALLSTSGNILLNGIIDSSAAGVTLVADSGSLSANIGSNVTANGASYFITPSGTIGVSYPVNVNINGSLSLMMGAEKDGMSGDITGVINDPRDNNMPIIIGESMQPINPPGDVYFNNDLIWNPKSEEHP